MSTVPSFIQQLLSGPDDVVLSQGELARLWKCLWTWRRDITPEERHKLQQIYKHNLKWPQKVEPQLQRLQDYFRMLPQLLSRLERYPQIDWGQVGKDLAESSLQTSSQPTSATPHAKKGRRGTQRGGAASQSDVEALIVAALTKHHRYGQGDFNWEPIGVRALARMAKVGRDSVSRFFKKHFGSHKEYQRCCRSRPHELLKALRIFNGDYSAKNLLGDKDKQIVDERF